MTTSKSARYQYGSITALEHDSADDGDVERERCTLATNNDDNNNNNNNQQQQIFLRYSYHAVMLCFLFASAICGMMFLKNGTTNPLLSDLAVLPSPSASHKRHRHHKIEDPVCDNCHDPPHYFHHQKVDHFGMVDLENMSSGNNEWTQRYYISDKHFGGPGHPIFLVIGGEGEALGLFYPYIQDYLAKHFHAYVLQPELRFYGQSQPIHVKKNTDFVGLLTSEQAMADFLALLEHTQLRLGCSLEKSSKDYCPVITVGGSYPGFISALLRIAFPDKIDISYASSAPLPLYGQDVNPHAYFELVTRTAEQVSGGCAKAVKETLLGAHAAIMKLSSGSSSPYAFLTAAKHMNMCLDKIPAYISNNEIFAQEVTMMVGQNFADFNMDFYPPPVANTAMGSACLIFQDTTTTVFEKMGAIFELIDSANDVEPSSCGFDMSTQLPPGPNATISAADWTGIGSGTDSLAWEFQCCTELVVQTGFSEQSMFYPREWSIEWLTQHCQSRFGISPSPTHLVDTFGFNDLSQSSRILFTNGLNDAWSTASITGTDTGPDYGTKDNSDIVVMNFPNGAHHSDLTHNGPTSNDTEDIKLGHQKIQSLLELWLDEIQTKN